ncbi:MAG: hypothetical protein HUJ74_01260 [Lachnospiraceae bacterium]|nr:hypothetical protein [Lachnospiraceae bacterium]
MNKLRSKLQNFMEGRYGIDEMGSFLLFLSLGMMLVSCFSSIFILYLITVLFLVCGYFRIFSRHQTKRWKENQKFLKVKKRFLGFFRKKIQPFRDKEHCYFQCPNCHCKKLLRVPKGKGNISIHCPQCHMDFVKRT